MKDSIHLFAADLLCEYSPNKLSQLQFAILYAMSDPADKQGSTFIQESTDAAYLDYAAGN